tara:strand:+ start:36 stop:296 length:261 start_codon:yes stop_codon:yes gene_type:complete
LSTIVYKKLCCFTSVLSIFVELVNLVNYKVYMSNDNNSKNKGIKPQINQKEDQSQYSQSGIYLRDDHCDWGSSGMNEYTNEYSESK